MWQLRKSELYAQYKRFGYPESRIKKLLKYDKEEFEKGTIDNKINVIIDNKNNVDLIIKDMIEYLGERYIIHKEFAFSIWDYSPDFKSEQ